MKWLIIGILVTITLFLLSRCKTHKNIRYVAQEKNKLFFKFKYQENDTIEHTLSLITTSIKKNSDIAMFLQTEIKAPRKYAEKLLSTTLTLHAKDSTGSYNTEIPVLNTYSHYTFYNHYYYSYGYGEKNYKGDFGKIIHLPNDINTEDRPNNMYIDNELRLNDYPLELKASIFVKWIGGEKTFETYLRLLESKPGSKVRTNPFG